MHAIACCVCVHDLHNMINLHWINPSDESSGKVAFVEKWVSSSWIKIQPLPGTPAEICSFSEIDISTFTLPFHDLGMRWQRRAI